MKKICIATDHAPKAIGPYSQAIKCECSGFMFCSGQIPLIPETGEIIKGGISEQTRQVLENLKAILEVSGLTLDHVIKTTVFLENMDSFPLMNEVYGKYFSLNPPARATVQVSRLPKDVQIEIEAIACY